MENTVFESMEQIVKIAHEMTANDFLLEFGQAVEFHDIDNLMDVNEGFTNISVDAMHKGQEVTVWLLFIDGAFENYSYN